MKLKNNIKSLRKSKGITQLELAKEIKVSRKTINTVENGVFIPSIILVLKIAKVLQVRVEELFWLED